MMKQTTRIVFIRVGRSGKIDYRRKRKFLLNNFSNLWLMGINVLKEGKMHVHWNFISITKYILQLIRIAEENADNWFNMTKNLEKKLVLKTMKSLKRLLPD